MERPRRNCPSEEFLQKSTTEVISDLKNKIEILFEIRIESNFPLSKEKIVTDDKIIKNIIEVYRRAGDTSFRGDWPSYEPLTGNILIPNLLYNERALIHEVLHAFSILMLETVVRTERSRFTYDKSFNRVLREGLTEFLTGCILFRFFPNCYEYFKQPDRYGDPDLGYRTKYNPKFWYVFVRVFGIEIIKQIYFDRSLGIRTYSDIHRILINHIRQKYPRFSLLDSNDIELWIHQLFLVSEDFEALYSITDKILDFSVFPFLSESVKGGR